MYIYRDINISVKFLTLSHVIESVDVRNNVHVFGKYSIIDYACQFEFHANRINVYACIFFYLVMEFE